jgi:hypothetical protein
VAAKSGPKLKDAVETPPPDGMQPPPLNGPLKLGADGYPELRRNVTMAWMNGRERRHDSKATTERLAMTIPGNCGSR